MKMVKKTILVVKKILSHKTLKTINFDITISKSLHYHVSEQRTSRMLPLIWYLVHYSIQKRDISFSLYFASWKLQKYYESISIYQTLVYFLLNVLNLGHTCQQNFNNTYNDCQTKEYIVKCLQMTELYLHSNRIHPHIQLLLYFCLHRRTKTNPSKPRSETSMISILKYIRRQRI